MTANERVKYQSLPGRRRGILRGASVWLGPDHLLLVRSMRFREEYRRFHMRDIQAISIASAPRFHISTRSIVIGFLWLVALTFAWPRGTWAQVALWVVAAALVGTWFYVSAACSCVCRIYTAVSRDDIPSIYRTWTARKFMRRVEPHIVDAQGAIEGDWQELLESRTIGPPEIAPQTPGEGIGTGSVPIGSTGADRTPAFSWAFVALMFADALVTDATKHVTSQLIWWAGYSILGLEIAVSIALLVQYSRGKVRAAMQRLVIASLLVTGATWYSGPLLTGISTAATAREGVIKVNGSLSASTSSDGPIEAAIHVIDMGAHILWGLAGLGITLADREKRAGRTPVDGL